MPSISQRGVEIVALTMLLLWYGWIADVTTGQKERPRDRCNKTVDIFEKVQSPLVTAKNRGQPLLCWYKFRVKTTESNNTMDRDWIISIRFFKFKVGRLVNATVCAEGYIQIIDGKDVEGVGSSSSATNEMTSRQSSTGFFCGEADHPNTLISETSQVKVVFSVDYFTEETYFAFDTRGEQQFQLFARHGQNPQLYPGRRGKLVADTTCDRIFEDCRLGTCYIQSPGYPGVYPRQLRCRYYVRTSSKYIRLYTENEHIDIDGQRCSDIILCPVRPVTKQCPHDQVQIYDGHSESSPLIGTFCGRGKFPYSIIGSGRELLLVFLSSPAGPLLSTGFNFHVGPFHKWIGAGATVENGSCDAVFHSGSNLPDGERRFHSLSTWYPPNTKCSFTILGEPDQVIRLRFKTFRVTEQQHAIVPSGECSETLTLYDSHTRDDSKLITTFCDTWSSPVSELEDFVSSGPAMFVQFTSLSGSYFASSLDYWVQFDFFNAFQYGTPVEGSRCDERFTPSSPKLPFDSPSTSTLTTSSFAPYSSSATTNSYSSSSSIQSPSAATISSSPHHPLSPTLFLRHGVFSSPLNNLVFRKRQKLNCRYSFDASGPNQMARVLVTFTSIHFTPVPVQQCISCQDDQVDKILIADPHDNATSSSSAALSTSAGTHASSYCLCDSSLQSRITNRSPITFLSTGPGMDVTLLVEHQHAEEYFARVNVPIFQGTYEFLHGYACGAPVLDVQNQGELMFPDPTRGYDDTVSEDSATSGGGGGGGSTAVRCIWTILISSMRKDVYMRFEHVNIRRNCSSDRIEIRIPDKRHAYGDDVRHTVCGSGEQALDFPIIPSTALTSNRILVEFRSLHVTEQSFKLVWTELSQVQEHVHHQSKFTSFQKMEMAAASTECAFVCEGSNTCIPQNLVCNGVRNCPAVGPHAADGAPSADEDLELCRREENTVNWLAIGLGAAGGAVLATCFILIIHRCCKKCHDASEPG